MCFLLGGKNAAYPQFRGRKGTKKLACAPPPPPKKKAFRIFDTLLFPTFAVKKSEKRVSYLFSIKISPPFYSCLCSWVWLQGGSLLTLGFLREKIYANPKCVGRKEGWYIFSPLFISWEENLDLTTSRWGAKRGGGESNPRLQLLKERGRN